jgi:hypothetical protein
MRPPGLACRAGIGDDRRCCGAGDCCAAASCVSARPPWTRDLVNTDMSMGGCIRVKGLGADLRNALEVAGEDVGA